jgi:hypothetical protein
MKQKLRNLLLQNSFVNRSNCNVIFVVALFYCFGARSQVVNFVNNGGFEDTLNGIHTNQFSKAKYWGPIDTNGAGYFVFSTQIGNAPYCSTGFQQPRHGKNFILGQFFCQGCGFNLERIYPRNRLKDKLTLGRTYCVKYYVVNTNNNRVAIENYGAYLADISLDTIHYCNIALDYITPQISNNNGLITDTLNWTAITGTFVSNGNEKYFVIGNFKSNSNTYTLQLNTPLAMQSADVYIDDVSIIDIDLPAYAGPDAWILPGDSVFIGRQTDVGIDEACIWYKMPNTVTAIDTVAGMWVKPSVTSTYIVKQEICSGIKFDTVVVNLSGVGVLENDNNLNLKLYPNLISNYLYIEFNSQINKPEQILIFNNCGVLKQKFFPNCHDLKCQINLDDLPNSIYYLKVITSDGSIIQRKIIKIN